MLSSKERRTRASRQLCSVASTSPESLAESKHDGTASGNHQTGYIKAKKEDGLKIPASDKSRQKMPRSASNINQLKDVGKGPRKPKRAKKLLGESSAKSDDTLDFASATPSTTTPSVDVEDLSDAFFPDGDVAKFRALLLDWYDHNHRKLPWRCSPEDKSDLDGAGENVFAYRVWVSEIMLQQTQVATVIAYFDRWMQRWPTLQELAKATQEEVNEAWAGLGYYRRARYLLDGAKHVVERHNGRIPRSKKDLLEIPGVGPYTAAAVASIVFGQYESAVDGNVIRVLTRLQCLGGDWSKRPLSKHIERLAHQLLDPERPGDFNQAMMELGAVQCLKSGKVDCQACPVRTLCKAHGKCSECTDGSISVTNWPAKVVKIDKRNVEVVTAVLRVEADGHGAAYLQVQRPQGGVLAGLWEFPSVVTDSPSALEQPLKRRQLMNDYLAATVGMEIESLGIQVVARKDLGEFQHNLTHIRFRVAVEQIVVQINSSMWEALAKGGHGSSVLPGSPGQNLRLVPVGDFEPRKMSSGVRKAYELLESIATD